MAGLLVSGIIWARLNRLLSRISATARWVVYAVVAIVALVLLPFVVLVLLADVLNLLARRIDRLRQLPVAATWGLSLVFVLVATSLAAGGRSSPVGTGTPQPTQVAQATSSPEGATPTTSVEPTFTPSATDTPSPVSTEEPTPEPTAGPAFETIKLSGKGTKVPKFSIPEDAAAIATITNKGTSNFVVWTVGTDGSTQDLLVNTIGSYRGTVLFDTDTHSVAFKVESNGSWTIAIEPVTSARSWDGSSSLAGKGDDVVLVQPAASGFVTVNITHKGSSNFVIWVYSLDGRDLLVNEIGNYSGENIIPDSTVLLQVQADGSWTVTPT